MLGFPNRRYKLCILYLRYLCKMLNAFQLTLVCFKVLRRGIKVLCCEPTNQLDLKLAEFQSSHAFRKSVKHPHTQKKKTNPSFYLAYSRVNPHPSYHGC